MNNKGYVVQVMGPVVDVEFPETLPSLQNLLFAEKKDGSPVALETAQLLGGNRVRTIALDSTDGLTRKTQVRDTGKPVTVPIGQGVLGRMFNVLGEPIDNLGETKDKRGSGSKVPRGAFRIAHGRIFP